MTTSSRRAFGDGAVGRVKLDDFVPGEEARGAAVLEHDAERRDLAQEHGGHGREAVLIYGDEAHLFADQAFEEITVLVRGGTPSLSMIRLKG